MIEHDFRIDSKREKVDEKIILDKKSVEYYLELAEIMHRLMYLSTGYQLNQEEIMYEPKHIEYTQKHRTNILNGLTKNEIDKLENDINILRELCTDWIDLTDDELNSRKRATQGGGKNKK